MLHQSRASRICVVALLMTIALLSIRSLSLAVENGEEVVRFGPLGIGRGEGLRVNVYAIGNPDILPRDFIIRVFNRQGVVVQEERLQLTPGAIGSMNVAISDPEDLPVERLGRRTLRAEIVGFNPQPDPPGRFAATLEVYSLLTGHTSILLGGPDTMPQP